MVVPCHSPVPIVPTVVKPVIVVILFCVAVDIVPAIVPPERVIPPASVRRPVEPSVILAAASPSAAKENTISVALFEASNVFSAMASILPAIFNASVPLSLDAANAILPSTSPSTMSTSFTFCNVIDPTML